MSTFKYDLAQEHILSEYLDGIYKSKKLIFNRVHDNPQQHRGIDLVIHMNGQNYIIDEKAQLHYINKDLPTFTFELSYLNKEGFTNTGWLLDTKKETQYYFLITGILLKYDNTNLSHPEDISCLKITSVNRKKLIAHLETVGLSKSRLIAYDIDLRHNRTYGKNPIPEFKTPKNGCLYFTEQLTEKPINLQLNLNYLIELNIAKRFYPNQ